MTERQSEKETWSEGLTADSVFRDTTDVAAVQTAKRPHSAEIREGERERERETERQRDRETETERQRQRETETETERR